MMVGICVSHKVSNKFMYKHYEKKGLQLGLQFNFELQRALATHHIYMV
jgi:hypothetical protein